MMICGIGFVDWVVKPGKCVSGLSFWWPWHASEELESASFMCISVRQLWWLIEWMGRDEWHCSVWLPRKTCLLLAFCHILRTMLYWACPKLFVSRNLYCSDTWEVNKESFWHWVAENVRHSPGLIRECNIMNSCMGYSELCLIRTPVIRTFANSNNFQVPWKSFDKSLYNSNLCNSNFFNSNIFIIPQRVRIRQNWLSAFS